MTSSGTTTVNQLIALHQEIESFRAELSAKGATVHGLGNTATRVKKECDALLKAFEHEDAEHRIASSNTTDLTRTWRLARSLPGLQALNAKFFVDPHRRRRHEGIIVDAVFRKGHAWCIKSSQRYRPLLQELANLPLEASSSQEGSGMSIDQDDEGHESDDSSSSSIDIIINPPVGSSAYSVDASGFGGSSTEFGPDSVVRYLDFDQYEEDPDDLFSLVNIKRTQIWAQMARVARCASNYLKLGAVPKVHLYLPRLFEDAHTDEAQLNCRRLLRALAEHFSVQILLGEPGDALPIDDNIEFRARDEFGNEEVELIMPSTSDGGVPVPRPIVLCVTTLFVLVSDLSHMAFVPGFVPHHAAQKHQLEEERRVRALRDRVFPLLAAGGRLHTTAQGRDRLLELSEQLGSVAEQTRARLLFTRLSAGDGLPDHATRLRALDSLSIHAWPQAIQLPIGVHDDSAVKGMAAANSSGPPPFTMKTRISQEVFDLAWHEPTSVLISANKGATTVMRKAMVAERVREAQLGPGTPRRAHPQVFLHAARSLAKYERPAFHGIPKNERQVMASLDVDQDDERMEQ